LECKTKERREKKKREKKRSPIAYFVKGLPRQLIHKVTSQYLLLEEIRFILLWLTGHFPARLLHGSDGSGTLMTVMTRGTADGRGTLGTRAEGLGPVKAFA
jgi:hypothetical protein